MLDFRLIAALLALTLASIAGAQTLPDGDGEPVTESEAPPEYQIEVIVFAHRDFNPNEEDFEHERDPIEPPTGDLVAAGLPASLVQRRETPAQPELEAPDPTSAGDEPEGIEGTDHPTLDPVIFGDPFASGSDATEASAQAGDVPPLPSVAPEAASAPAELFHFRLLRPEEFTLDDVYARLDRLGAYVPLLHGGWVQPGLPEDQAHPFDLSVLGGINPRGTIELYLSRFLHINVDLSYQPLPQAGRQYGWQSADAVGLGEFALPPRYSLHAERRLRSGELHYIDHPAFGVLIQIRPQPAAKPHDAAQPAA